MALGNRNVSQLDPVTGGTGLQADPVVANYDTNLRRTSGSLSEDGTNQKVTWARLLAAGGFVHHDGNETAQQTTDRLQTLLDARGAVYLEPYKTWQINAPLRVGSNTEFNGCNGTIEQTVPAQSVLELVGPSFNFSIQNLTVTYSTTPQTDPASLGIDLCNGPTVAGNSTRHFLLENIVAKGAYRGFSFNTANGAALWLAQFRNLFARDCYDYGFRLEAAATGGRHTNIFMENVWSQTAGSVEAGRVPTQRGHKFDTVNGLSMHNVGADNLEVGPIFELTLCNGSASTLFAENCNMVSNGQIVYTNLIRIGTSDLNVDSMYFVGSDVNATTASSAIRAEANTNFRLNNLYTDGNTYTGNYSGYIAAGANNRFWNKNFPSDLNFASGSRASVMEWDGAGVSVMSDLPTSDPTVAGQLWNDAGTVKVSAG